MYATILFPGPALNLRNHRKLSLLSSFTVFTFTTARVSVSRHPLQGNILEEFLMNQNKFLLSIQIFLSFLTEKIEISRNAQKFAQILHKRSKKELSCILLEEIWRSFNYSRAKMCFSSRIKEDF